MTAYAGFYEVGVPKKGDYVFIYLQYLVQLVNLLGS